MTGPAADRDALRAQQAALLAALLEGAAPPPGFDAGRVAAQARALGARRTAYAQPGPERRSRWAWWARAVRR